MFRTPRFFLAALLLIAAPVRGATLGYQLSAAEVDSIIQQIGQGSAVKLLRGAEAPRNWWPGFRFGAEVNILLPGALSEYGDRTGDVPGLAPMPRLYLAKAFPLDTEVIFSFIPSSIVHTSASTGVILKWSFINELDKYFAAAAFAGYTSYTAFGGELTGSTYEIGAVVSKDYVRIKPYVGLGLLFAKGTVDPNRIMAGVIPGSWENTLHLFAGAELGLLPIDIAFQIDFFNLTPRGSMFFGKSF